MVRDPPVPLLRPAVRAQFGRPHTGGFFAPNALDPVAILDATAQSEVIRGGDRASLTSSMSSNATPEQVLLFASSSDESGGRSGKPGGIFRLRVPYSVGKPDDIAAPKLEADVRGIQVLVSGGVTDGTPDESVLVAINGTTLLHRSTRSGGALVAHRLPVRYPPQVHRPAIVHFDPPPCTPSNSLKILKGKRPCAPWQIAFKYEPGPDGKYILGPCSHDRTVSLAVSPADSTLLAVTGWPSLVDNSGLESVWLSKDAGAHFVDVTANLRDATGTVGRVRPSALLLVPVPGQNTTALLVGTVNGVHATMVHTGAHTISTGTKWVLLGACANLPLVLVAGLSYQPLSDTIVAGTMGRGVYAVHGASKLLQDVLA